MNLAKPFLWNFIEEIANHQGASDAREKRTESANEEHYSATIVLE